MSRSIRWNLTTILALLAVLVAGASGATTGPPSSEDSSRPCFIEPPRWNVALDGPLPRC